MNALDYLRPHIGKQETLGPNRGPFVDMLNDWVGAKRGSSWCATTPCWAFHQADPHTNFPKTAGSQELLRQLRLLGCEVTRDAQRMLRWRGAIAIRTNPKPDDAHGHVVPLQKRFTIEGPFITAVLSLEGNSSHTGSSNGDGLYENRRTIPLIGDWHYISTDIFGSAGEWWPA